MGNKKLVKEVFDVNERLIGVYQDHDGVTLDLGLTDRNLTMGQAAALMVWVGEAINAAQLWADDTQGAPDAEA